MALWSVRQLLVALKRGLSMVLQPVRQSSAALKRVPLLVKTDLQNLPGAGRAGVQEKVLALLAAQRVMSAQKSVT